MGPPVNSTYIVQGEMHVVVMAMRRGMKWSSHGYQELNDPLVRSLMDLKEILNHVADFADLEPNQFLGPFLEVIRSGDTTGPVTGLALSSVNKFLTYGLIDATCETASSAVENITDAVTHARFVGTDPGSDEVVLMKILTVLRTLMLSPVGVLLSNESFCEIMQSCFRICFEMRLSELLRKSAESALVDMAQLLFARLPHFKDETGNGTSMRKLKMRTGAMMDTSRSKTKRKTPKIKDKKYLKTPSASGSLTLQNSSDDQQPQSSGSLVTSPDNDAANTTPAITPLWGGSLPEVSEGNADILSSDGAVVGTTGVVDMQENLQAVAEAGVLEELVTSTPSLASSSLNGSDGEIAGATPDADYVNPRGVRFTPQQPAGDGPLVPYGLPCIGELFRFLVSLINPLDKQNSEVMIHIGLSLLTVSLETNAIHIGNFPSLLTLVKDELCRNLFFLLNSERFSLFVASMRVCFLLFEALRSHLKFQLEMYLNKLMIIIVSESPKVLYEQRETVLDSLVQLWCIPGFVTELYLNYDCDLHCSNLFEELTKLLSKNAFPVSGLFSTHLLSLDALLTVIDGIENHCHAKVLRDRQIQSDRHRPADVSANNDSRVEIWNTSASDALTAHLPKASGYLLAQSIFANDDQAAGKSSIEQDRCGRGAMTYENAPSFAELVNIKHKKKLLLSGTDQFNAKPAKGILFLQENGMLSSAADPSEIAHFLKENPRLDKKMIGEYISNRKNLKILESFVKSFCFEDARIDEALRMYLETFRLPGEAPVISLLMEHFAEHWHKSNGEPFVNSDAAFTLAYAVIMLNVDQHNNNAKKQSIPMTLEDFKKNLSRVNGGQDFDADMLEEIYIAIRNEEIVMPAEQTGLVRENYLWKMLLRRGLTKDGVFIHAPSGQFDRNLFALIWGPTVAALSFVFDKSTDDAVVQRTISGFRKCAMIAAHYGMSDVFDHLMISLCKFTTLLNNQETPETIPITFGGNAKAQLAAKTVFNLAHRHGDILREGWRNVLDCLLLLYNARLLPEALVVVEDFVDPSGSISLLRRRDADQAPTASQRSDAGLFSSFYSYITLNNADLQAPRGLTLEDEECTERAQACILSCHPEHLVSESKFLRADSLQELVKALIFASPGPDSHASHGGSAYNEDATVFFLELLVDIVLHNRDRVNVVWQVVRDHIYGLMMGASATEYVFLVERSVVSILRLAVRLLWREDMTAQVLQSLKMLLVLKPSALLRVSRQITFALYELFKNNAANIHAAHDWTTLFTLLEYAGAGARPPRVLDGITLPLDSNDSASENGVQSDSESTNHSENTVIRSPDRGYTSDSELYELQHSSSHKRDDPGSVLTVGSWIMVAQEGSDASALGPSTEVTQPSVAVNQYDIVLRKDFVNHDTPAFLKACESLAFLVRDAAHITRENFESCVHCIRTFTEASLHGGRQNLVDHRSGVSSRTGGSVVPASSSKHQKSLINAAAKDRRTHRRRKDVGGSGGASDTESSRLQRSTSASSVASLSVDATDEEIRKMECSYHQVSVQLLDLMHTLHTRAAAILITWVTHDKQQQQQSDVPEDTGVLWSRCWCPLLQGIARLCCDSRRQVRTTAVTYLQRALLVHDLQTLSALEWEACFNKILFPLLMKLLDNLSPNDPTGVEETRVRGATLLCKVFLQHLTPLLSLSTFTALWLTILDFMDKYMHADKSDLLCEAIPESLKNMLLVMDTAGIFSRTAATGNSQLWTITWDRIDAFLPSLKDEVFKSHQRDGGVTTTSDVPAQLPSTTAACVIEIDAETSPAAAAEEAASLTDVIPASESSPAPLILQPPTSNAILQTIPLVVNTGLIRDGSTSQAIPIVSQVFVESEIVSVMRN